MSRGPLLTVAIGAVLVVVAGALLLGRDDSGSVPVLGSELLATSSRLDPQTPLFGQPVHARVEAVYDTERVQRGSLRIEPDFGAYRIAKRRETRTAFGRVDRVRFEWELECLTARCLPRKEGIVQFPRTQLAYATRDGASANPASIEWPQLKVAARVGPEDLKALSLQADARDLPAAGYRVRPRTLAVVGYTLAALLALAGLLLLARALDVRAHFRDALAGRRSRLSALRRALALVHGHVARGEHDRSRPALESLAGELRNLRERELALDASRLAWRRADPAHPTVDPLSDDVEQVIAREEQ